MSAGLAWGADGLSAAFHRGRLRRPLTVPYSWAQHGIQEAPDLVCPAGPTSLSWSGDGAQVVLVFGVSPGEGALEGGTGQPWGQHQTSRTVIGNATGLESLPQFPCKDPGAGAPLVGSR